MMNDIKRTSDTAGPTGFVAHLHRDRAICAAATLLMVAGIVPRLTHFCSGRALWFDEAALCINVVERGFAGLIEPLAFKQIAPLLYLWALKGATWLLGETVYAVRLPSLVGGIAGLVLFWLVARRVLRPGGALIALGMAAFSQHLIYYTGEAKPYALDAAVLLLVCYLALRLESERSGWRFTVVATVFFAVFVWLSYPSVFAMAGVGLVQLGHRVARRDIHGLIRRATPYAVGAASFLLVYVLVVRPNRAHTETMEYMAFYWRHGFMPFPPVHESDFRWFRERTFMFFDKPGGFTLPGLALFCWLTGVVALGARRPWYTAGLLMPLALTLVASALKLYPFHGRMTLFLAPIIFLFMGAGVAWLLRCSGGKARYIVGAVLLALLLAQPIVRAARMAVSPVRHHELGTVLTEVEAAWEPGDRLFLRQADYISYRFLEHRYGFPADAVLVERRGAGTAGEEEAFLARLASRLPRWGRVWFPMAYDYETTVQGYVDVLEAHGEEFAHFTARGASAYGFDFGGPGRGNPGGDALER